MATAPPKVRADLEYFDQVIDGDEMVLVRDPVRNQYFRFNTLQVAMLRALDGHRTPTDITAELSVTFEVEVPPEAADRFIVRARDLMLLDLGAYTATSAAARREVAKALAKAGFRFRTTADAKRMTTPESRAFADALRELELGHPRAAASHLRIVMSLNPDNVRARELYDIVEKAFIRAAGATSDFPTFVLFNPQRMLLWMSRTFGKFLFSGWGVLAILAYLAVGAYALTFISFDRARAEPLDLLVAISVYTFATLVHEVGHGLACQHYGGNVTEIGFTMFFYIKPAAYCDTSSSYVITDRRHKVVVQLGGTAVTLVFIATTAIFLAIARPSLPIYPGLVLELVLEGTLAFVTLIPFMKFDGYYAICDWFGFPNLRDRSFKLAKAWVSKSLLGIELSTEELPARTRRRLIVYAVMSFVFTGYFIYVAYASLITPMIAHFRLTGLILAVALSLYLMRNIAIRPVVAFARLLVSERRTVFTLRRTIMISVVLLALVGPWFIRYPVLIDAGVSVVPVARVEIRPLVAGRVEEILVQEGDSVRPGQVLARLGNPLLAAERTAIESQLAASTSRLAQLRAGARPEQLEVSKRARERQQRDLQASAADARMAAKLAAAHLGTASAADRARELSSRGRGEADAALASEALVRAGARPQEIAIEESVHAQLEAQLAKVREDLDHLTLRSPIAGVVVTPHLQDLIQTALRPGEALLGVQDIRTMHAEIALPANEPIGEISPGDEIVLNCYGAPADKIRTRVARLRDAAERDGNQTRTVVITEPFATEHQIAGLTGRARIYGTRRSLAYAKLWIPLYRAVNVRFWSL